MKGNRIAAALAVVGLGLLLVGGTGSQASGQANQAFSFNASLISGFPGLGVRS